MVQLRCSCGIILIDTFDWHIAAEILLAQYTVPPTLYHAHIVRGHVWSWLEY